MNKFYCLTIIRGGLTTSKYFTSFEDAYLWWQKQEQDAETAYVSQYIEQEGGYYLMNLHYNKYADVDYDESFINLKTISDKPF